MPRTTTDKAVGVSVTVKQSDLDKMDVLRGDVTRTRWISVAITQRLDREAKRKVKP